MELQKGDGPYPRCYKCNLELNPWSMRDPLTGHCPRCANDLSIIDITDALVDPQEIQHRVAQNEYFSLMQILNNWADAYQRLVAEKGVDWSLPHEYLQDVAEQMMPYVARLLETENFTKEHISGLGGYFQDNTSRLIISIQAAEDDLRLSGGWTENEQEIKDYWQERFSKEYGLTFQQYIQLSMRNEQRQSSDCGRLCEASEEDS